MRDQLYRDYFYVIIWDVLFSIFKIFDYFRIVLSGVYIYVSLKGFNHTQY